MKKLFFLSVFLLCCLLCNAQLTTYSSNDTNLDGGVSVADVSKVASSLLSGSSDDESQVVDVKELNQLLKSIDARLAAIEAKLNTCKCGSDTVGKDTVIEVPSLHQYVDLGLPSGTLWATCNVGANSPEDYGLYFAWGETKGYTGDTSDGRSFAWTIYKWCNGSSSTMTKYCTSSSYGTVDNKTELEPEDDAATVNWGKDWQMPSIDQIKELINSNYTTTQWTTHNGINGRLIISKTNGNSVFLPAAGCRSYIDVNYVGSSGNYWSRSCPTNYSCYARNLGFGSGDIDRSDYERFYGFSVRPVRSVGAGQNTTR